MTAGITTHSWRLLLACLALLLCWAPQAEAQFETPNRQFHNETTFPLNGRHRDLTCESCHQGGVYKGTPTRCFDCHWARRQDDRFRLQLGAQCEQCHTTTAWTAVQWDHTAMTGMPLGAAHRQLNCQACHESDSFQTAKTTCIACHAQDYQATTMPNHAAAGFPTTCESCHRVSDSTFQQARFDHASTFPLLGVHALQACETCHTSGVFRGTSRDCVGCHRPLYDQTRTPNHAAAGFPTTCENCHRPTDSSWGGNGFNHAAVFPLVGVHAQQSCASCHVNNVFLGTPTDCVGCHRPLYDQTRTPNHAAAGFPTTCESCHRPTDTSWAGSAFNHATVFPLVGVHAQQDCATCHVNNVFQGTPTDCVGCHRPLYDQTTAPSHAAAGFPTTCESCHRSSDSSWTGATFDHASVFALVGRHAQATCASCHINNVYVGTPRDCVGCHINLYNVTTSPSHVAAGFPTTCESCHRATDTAWTQGTFNHQFPITSGNHNVSCATCHQDSGTFQTFTCLVCHAHDRPSMDDHHRSISGYRYDSLACYSCHPNGRH